MKVDLLKKLIKEAVKEAVREELKELLLEKTQPSKIDSTLHKLEDRKRTINQNTDPITEMINMTKSTMESDDYRNILNFQSSDAKNFLNNQYNQGTNYSQNYSTHQTGLDISNLDFVKNASKVYKASIEKDKQKNGL